MVWVSVPSMVRTWIHMVRALPPARSAGRPRAKDGRHRQRVGTGSAPRASAHGVGGAGERSGRYPALCLARRGRNFKPRAAGATLLPAIRAARPARRGAGEGKGAEQIPQRSPIPPRQRRSRRVPAGRRRAGLRGCAGSHRPARALFTGERRRAHMEVTAPTPISRERPAAAVQTTRRGGSGGGGSEAGARHHHAPSRRAPSPSLSAPRPVPGRREARGGSGGGRRRLHGSTRGAEGCEGPAPAAGGRAAPGVRGQPGTALPRI